MRVHVVDPSAYTPPYDHALCNALALAGANVRLYTSHFAYDTVPPPDGYRRLEFFYRGSRAAPGRSRITQRARRALKLAEHVPDMLRYRRAARDADVVHFQWLTVPQLDERLLPARRLPDGRRRPLVLSAHDVLAREPSPGQRAAQLRLYGRFDAVIVHSEHGRERLTGELGVDPARVHVIPHGAFKHLADAPPAPAPFQTRKQVVLFFGLLRPYKGIDVLLDAWRGIDDAELWIVGMPRMDISALRARAPASVRFVSRFVPDHELPSYFRRADLVVLPYREIEQSGVLFTALAFGKPLLISDVGGFGEVAAAGAARAVAPGDSQALRAALVQLLGDRAALASLAENARVAATTRFAWGPIGHRTLELYVSLLPPESPSMRTALEIVFWLSAALIVWTQLGYAAALALLARIFAPGRDAAASREPAAREEAVAMPWLSLIVAAHDEEPVIAEKLSNALALDYPRERLELIIACDGCSDATAQRAREHGADVVLELPRGGKILAQDAAVERARGEIVAFSDANSTWDPGAARALVSAFADPRVGYACGQVRFVQDATGAGASNQEGIYWRYELAVRALESRLSSITAGNGAIYATRRDSYIVVDPIMGHDLSLPFKMVKRGLRAVYVQSARASEKMVPSLMGEFARKRRMMSHTWPIVLRGGMLSPRGYPPAYALMILSHRLLRYCTPGLHALALAGNVALVAIGAGPLYVVTLALQLALLLAALLAGALHARPFLIARYYVLSIASPAAGLWDWIRHGTTPWWDAAEGTR